MFPIFSSVKRKFGSYEMYIVTFVVLCVLNIAQKRQYLTNGFFEVWVKAKLKIVVVMNWCLYVCLKKGSSC